jgi:uncharacterized protein
MTVEYFYDSLVIQPISSCNLNCTYCYLPHRNSKNKISLEVIYKVKEAIETNKNIKIVHWHCGEPLMLEFDYFKYIIGIIHSSGVKQSVQTNATLIDDKWCQLFIEYGVRVSVSIDGNYEHNRDRVTWSNKSSFYATLAGIEKLQQYDISFDVLCVINRNNISQPKEVFAFLKQLGCDSIGFNIEEIENNNNRNQQFSDDEVIFFWEIIFEEWLKDSSIRIREIDDCLSSLNYATETENYGCRYIDLIPTISFKGDIFLLSPEFLDAKSKHYNNFVIGNIITGPISGFFNKKTPPRYIEDYIDGINNCSKSCEYFVACGGGYASNKFFENSDLTSTCTQFCLYSRKLLIDTILKNI